MLAAAGMSRRRFCVRWSPARCMRAAGLSSSAPRPALARLHVLSGFPVSDILQTHRHGPMLQLREEGSQLEQHRVLCQGMRTLHIARRRCCAIRVLAGRSASPPPRIEGRSPFWPYLSLCCMSSTCMCCIRKCFWVLAIPNKTFARH